MLGFLFGKSNFPLSGTKTKPAQPKVGADAPAPVLPAAKPPVIPVAIQLAALAALPDGDEGVMQVALSAAPDEVRAAALSRLTTAVDHARIAVEAKVADTRHAAVLALHDEALLTEVAQQTRTRDKRVYKAARERLDGYARERERLAMQAHWLDVAEQLAASQTPELSRVVELERVWSALQPDVDADQRFQHARSQLREALQAQASLRRDAGRLVNERREQARDAQAEAAQQGAVVGIPANPALATDPAGHAGAAVAGDLVVNPEQAAAETAVPATSSATAVAGTAVGTADAGAAAMPADQDGADPAVATTPLAAARQGSGAGQSATAAPPRRGKKAAAAATPEQREALVAAVAALEQALEDGHLQDAETQLQALSLLQSQLGGASGSAGGRIRRAAEEIARLRAWRRWGGQQARDHLCEAAEALPGRDLPVEEIARAVRALRAQWQEAAAQESGVPHALWERFDAACERAWEPVRVHFAAQAERRAANQMRREALVASLEAQVLAVAQPPVDWRAVGVHLAESGRQWRTLGPVDRKVSRPLEARYLAAVAALEQPLRAIRATEEAERAALIRAAEQLGAQPEGRDTVTRLRALQADWQTRSRGAPLPRAREQALWEAFRTACDQVFSARDAARQAEHAERAAQVQAQDEVFRKRSAAWQVIGDAAGLLAATEQTLVREGGGDPALLGAFESAWQAMPPCPNPVAQRLQVRHARVLASVNAEACAELCNAAQSASAILAAGLLELEIGLGLPSPDGVQAERRQVQLRKLADSLRSGGRADTDSLQAQAMALLAWPCTDGSQQQRLLAVLQALAPQRPATTERSARPARPEGNARHEGASGRRDGARPPRAR